MFSSYLEESPNSIAAAIVSGRVSSEADISRHAGDVDGTADGGDGADDYGATCACCDNNNDR